MTSGRAGSGQTTQVAAQTATSSSELAHTGLDTGYLLAAGVGGIAAGTAMVRKSTVSTAGDSPDADDAPVDNEVFDLETENPTDA